MAANSVRPAAAQFQLLLSLLLAVSSCAGLGAVRYEHRMTDDPLSIHIAWVDPSSATIRLERAHGRTLGRETVTTLARRAGAAAAVNGSFFVMGGQFDGDPAGIVKIGDQWFSDSGIPRGALGWKEGGRSALIGQVTVSWTLSLDGHRLKVDGINHERGAWTIVVYTSEFNSGTLAHPGGTEFQVDSTGRVLAMEREGNCPIPRGGFVISFGSRVPPSDPEQYLGKTAVLEYEFVPADGAPPSDWRAMEFIVGGTPVLIRDGVPVDDYSREGVREAFVLDRHPRTAVGIRPDGTWVLVVVDGRRPGVSIGLPLRELASFMLSLGCRDALNLDGGGSSTFFFDGRVMNQPSDLNGERPVSDAIVVISSAAGQ